MQIETVDDVLNELADRFMVYGACKSEDPEGCFVNTHFCCRVGFMAHYEDRFREAVENEQKLDRMEVSENIREIKTVISENTVEIAKRGFYTALATLVFGILCLFIIYLLKNN